MSVERSFEAWEEIHRQGQDLADRLAQGFTGLIAHPPPFSWPPATPKTNPFELELNSAAILDIGSRIGQAGAEFGAGINGMVQQLFRQLPAPFRHEEVRVSAAAAKAEIESRSKDDAFEGRGGELGSFGGLSVQGLGSVVADGRDEELGDDDDDGFGFDVRTTGRFKKSRVSSCYYYYYYYQYVVFLLNCNLKVS